MKDIVIDTIKQYKMIEENDKIVVAVSGGPDSICLLDILNSLKNELSIKELYVAHLNHCIRGVDADNDEKYVENYCKAHKLSFFGRKVDVIKLAKDQGISTESAGRKARYDFFYELKKNLNAEKIAIAHNANDQAETMLMRIMRGTGLEGLVGIKPVRDNIYIRPLIKVMREDIENYCLNNNLNPRIDKTNLENIYTRNKIRLELIPFIKNNFNEDIINTLVRLSNILSKDNNYLEKVTLQEYERYCSNKGKKVIISKEAFYKEDAIITRVIRKALSNICGNLNNFQNKHIYEVINLQNNSTGKKILLPNNIKVENIYGNIYIGKYNKSTILKNEKKHLLSLGNNSINNLEIQINILKEKPTYINKSNKYIQFFDWDKICNKKLYIRNRQSGDRFTPLGMNGSKKIKDIFMDLKVPREERDAIHLICFGEEIAWIVGYRISNKFKIDKNTKNILQIIIKDGDRNEEDK
ncbi:tRNA lysidine(34) synthetase TilS [Clostridium niameyense]|uniref:tRNA(Ile)-lysidine synthase n=1 Tax=Clostridium niameyense TaxID=1622073 RepID=A0A6M0REA1_9CLOT|nr:tRNA lysidine(34) synthetase TilS [Clostridium niameyense]NEZ47999.1 tRNA lysidine(34) synthetase TilS [Clostridium niameyense]